MVGEATKERRLARTLNRSRAKEMRHAPVSMEDLLWSHVRNRQLGGHKIKRQVLIDPYIVDFVCTKQRVIIELDGPLHANRKGYDAARDAFLRGKGYRVERFDNDAFKGDLALMLRTIEHVLSTPSPRPLPLRGRGRSKEPT